MRVFWCFVAMLVLSFLVRKVQRGLGYRHAAPRQLTRPGLDPVRYATPRQRRQLYQRQRGLCWWCKRRLAGTRVECHHILAWSRGGRTELANLALVHAWPCHEQLTRMQARTYGWRRR